MRTINIRQKTLQNFGVKYEVLRDGQQSHVVVAKDALDTDGVQPRKYLMLLLEADVKVGDEMVNSLTGERGVVEELLKKTSRGQLHGLDAYYVDEREAQRRIDEDHRATQPQGTNFSIGTNYGIVGTQQHASQTQTFDMRSVEAEIERRGVDVEELKQLVREFGLLTEQQEIPRGSLARFSESLEKHSWLTGSLTAALMSYLTR